MHKGLSHSLHLTQLTQTANTQRLSGNVHRLSLTFMADIHFIRLLSTHLLFPAFITITYIHTWVTLGCMEEKKISDSAMN